MDSMFNTFTRHYRTISTFCCAHIFMSSLDYMLQCCNNRTMAHNFRQGFDCLLRLWKFRNLRWEIKQIDGYRYTTKWKRKYCKKYKYFELEPRETDCQWRRNLLQWNSTERTIVQWHPCFMLRSKCILFS